MTMIIARYPPGTRVRYQDMEGVIEEVLQGPTVHYRVAFPHKKQVVPEPALSPAIMDPVERLLAGEFEEDCRYFDLRTRAAFIRAAYTFEDLASLTNARVELMPHQVFVAHRVVQQPRPRFLLADEVGLGKTIEAGMILKELRARGLVERVLIVVPANLVVQWRTELHSKFNEDFIVYDGITLRYLERERPGENPWALSPRIITSVQFARLEERREQIAQVEWDLVIVDEAHHLRRYLEGYDDRGRAKVRHTQTYLLGEAASGKAGSVLFLTATPLQLRSFELYSLLELVDPSLFEGFQDFERFRSVTLPLINEAHGLLSSPWSAESYRRLYFVWEQLQKESGNLPPLPPLASLDNETSERCRSGLREVHRLARAMIRNRRREIGGFPPRVAHVIPVELTPQEKMLYDEVSAYIRRGYRAAKQAQDVIGTFLMVTYQKILASSTRALQAALERRRSRLVGEILDAELAELVAERKRGKKLVTQMLTGDGEGGAWEAEELSLVATSYEKQSEGELIQEEVQTLDNLIDRIRGIPQDSKALTLMGAIRRIFETDPDEKVLIFTQFLETQRYLKELLQQAGYTVEVFAGNMPAEEKNAAVERFKDHAQIMISTEAGGEGRNFQFCHIMFNYDLPWNPMRIEQRIGRLDRIGQRRAVHIYNLAAVGTIEERVLAVLHGRIRLFEETIGGLDPILGDFEQDLERLIMQERPNFAKEFENFGIDWEKRVADARAMEERLRDFVMDFRSFRRDEADRLLGRDRPISHTDLRNLVRDFLALYPTGKFEEHHDGTVAIEVPPAFVEQLGGKVRDTYVGTFDPKVALAKESLDFLAIGHPLVDAVLELCGAARFGGLTCIRVVESEPDRGFWGVQCHFLVEFVGVRPYPRFMPVIVGLDGSVDKCRIQRLWKAPTILANPPSLPEGWREKASAALRRAEYLLIEQIDEEAEELQRRNDEDCANLTERTEKLYRFRLQRARERLEEDRAILERLTQSRDPDDQRVVPIWQKRVQGSLSRIRDLEHQREQELQALEDRRRLNYSFERINCAIVYVAG